jgi:methylene-tetrahydromethanopterin dehydrogenase
VGNVKYQVHQRLLARMRESGRPELLSFPEALAQAREVLAGKGR